METGEFKIKNPRRFSAETTEQLEGLKLGSIGLLSEFTNRRLTCSHCKRCTSRCEVLSIPNIDIGEVDRAYCRITKLPESEQVDATIQAMQERPELYHALRRCCFCGHCTSQCRSLQFAPEIMRKWRELFSRAGFMPPNDSRMVMVDNEWHIFSAYRAIYGIDYPQFKQLANVAEQGKGVVDTVLFPGCSLTSYTPQLVQAVGNWLDQQGFAWALSLDCCGSPLMSAGMFERANNLRQKIVDQMCAAGIKRMITVCPGCGEELAENMPTDIDIIPLPELIYKHTKDARNAKEAHLSPLDPAPASYTVFDSCHDRRDNRHGLAIRQLLAKYLPQAQRLEIDYRHKNSLCCGAGGAVAGYDDEISARRVARIIDEARKTGAETLVSMCPTCSYTIGQANLGQPILGRDANDGIRSHHYLELLFGIETNWATIFAQLEGMWSGEYGPWLNETFFS